MAKPHVDVAIAILLHQAQVLVGWREAKQHQGNKYEFPGGKVEAGESAIAACRREVQEEVGIDIADWYPFACVQHEYDDVIVNLNIFHAHVSMAQIQQIQAPWTWYTRAQLLSLNFPKANAGLLQRLYWAQTIQIAAELKALDHLAADQWLYWCSAEPIEAQLVELAELSVATLPRLVVNMELWQAMNSIQQANVAAIQLEYQQLMQLQKGDLKLGQRYMASCHDVCSVQYAQQIGCDAVLLGPISPTPTQPEGQALGWEQFAEIAQHVHLPVFALQGVMPADLETAQRYHGYGVAGRYVV